MKLTELKISRRSAWSAAGPGNPLVCTVKLESERAVVETVLSEEDTAALLKMVQRTVADSAAQNIAAFVEHVGAIEAAQDRGALESLT